MNLVLNKDSDFNKNAKDFRRGKHKEQKKRIRKSGKAYRTENDNFFK